MNEILIGSAVMFGVAGFFGVVLAVAYRKLSVEEDPRIEVVENMLPGTNCGACGQPGCHAFAEALCRGETAPGICTVSAPEAIEDMATFLGVAAGTQEKRVARLHCAGGASSVKQLAAYRGIASCRAAFVVNGGGRACAWGCLGLGDCETACTFDAIAMNVENLPKVDVDLCTACNDCVEVCPLDLFTLEPVSHHVLVQCASPLIGDAARASCKVACDACGRCALDAAEGSIEMAGGLPQVVLPSKAGRESTYRCPTGAIQYIEGNQFDDIEIGVRDA